MAEPDRASASGEALAQDPTEAVLAAVEAFIDKHSRGDEPDPAAFAAGYSPSLRPRILTQIRQFLQFDGFVGQESGGRDEAPAPQGRQFGDYVIQEELGRGGMGVVYLAQQRSLNRRVALKVMASGLTLSKRHVERFRREAAAAAQLHHPAIVPVHSFTEVDGTLAFAMDFVAGRNLTDILDDLRLRNPAGTGPIEGTLGVQPDQGYVAECAILCSQLAGALAVAHKAGIAHRDIKPRNLMVDENRQPRLLDFGLAKSLGEGSISLSGEITGTAHYMSPEQTLAKRVQLDHRTDIFSLGVILYEVLTLKRPFDGKNLQQVVYEICFKEPVPIWKLNPKVPRDLTTICMKALEKDPQRRYQTAAEMEADLLRFLRWEPIHARPAGTLTRVAKWIHRHRPESIAIGVGLAVLVAGLSLVWYRNREDWRIGGELLAQAEAATQRHDFEAAIGFTSEALKKRPDDATIPKQLELIQQKRTNKETREQLEVAKSSQLITKSNQVLDTDRELALVLALEAVQLRDKPETRSAVLQALGSGYRVTTLKEHDGHVYGTRFDATGARCATSGIDHRALLWDVASGSVLKELKGHSQWVVGTAFQPGGELVATASQDRTARLWVAATGETRHVLPHDGTVDLVQFDGSGRRLLTASNQGQDGPALVQVWDVARAKVLGACKTHTRSVALAALAPDGETVASYGDPGFVRVWRAEDGSERKQLPHEGRAKAIAWSADSSKLAIATEKGEVRVYGAGNGELLATLRHSRAVHSVCFDAQDRLLTAGDDHTARLWDLEAGGRELQTFTGHSGPVLCARFDSKGRYVVTGSEDRTVRLFDPSTAAELARYEAGMPVTDVALDAEAHRVLVQAGQRALIWDLTDTHGTVIVRHPSYVRSPFFLAGGEQLATVCDDECVRIWNVRNGQLVRSIPITGFRDPMLCGSLDQKGERLVIGTFGGEVSVLSVWDGKVLFQLEGHAEDKKVHCVAFAADGSRVVSCSDDGTAVVWNANDRSRIRTVTRDVAVLRTALSPDGTRLCTVDKDDHKARLWSVQNQGEPLVIGCHTGVITCVSFDPGGTLLLTASEDQTACISRVDTGELVQTLRTDRPVRHAAFAADGSRVLTCSSSAADHVAQVWDVREGKELLRFTGHLGRMTASALSPDGAWAVTCSNDRTARVWPTDPVAVARRLSLRALTAAERISLGLPPLESR